MLLEESASESEKQEFLRECNVLSNLRHGNIIGVLGACTDSKNCFLLTELMPNGTLFDVLHEKRVPLTSTQRHEIVLGILMGMNNMHMRRVFHRDLKSANILVDAHFTPKIADFGFAKQKSAAKAKELFQSKVCPPSKTAAAAVVIFCVLTSVFRLARRFGWHPKCCWAKSTTPKRQTCGVLVCLCSKSLPEKFRTPRPASKPQQRRSFAR
jgi:serine/threonine protein kinase